MPLRVGTDCSGIESVLHALRKLGVPYDHAWSADIDKDAIAHIKEYHAPRRMFGDITQRDVADLPAIDLYVAGFPCQSFSAAGRRGGFDDPRGTVFWSCLEVIRAKRPQYFILENVRGLQTHRQGRTFATVWKHLTDLPGYTVKWKVLNTRDLGIPQNRPRLFMVGSQVGDFEWPQPVPMADLSEFVDWEDTTKKQPHPSKRAFIQRAASQPPRRVPKASVAGRGPFAVPNDRVPQERGPVYVRTGFANRRTTFPSAHLHAPCLTVSGMAGYYNIAMGRPISVREALALQGLPTDLRFPSKAAAFRLIGNSMTVNVMAAILRCLGVQRSASK
jgi:DNA (cytosine-5)-methyltransferase 1